MTNEQQSTDAQVDNQQGAAAEAQTAEAGTEQQAEGAEAKTTEGEQPKEGEAEKPKEGEGNEATGAPEEYADFSAPEGVELDAEVLGDFKTTAKELNLTQDQAQKVVDLGAKMLQGWTAQANEHHAATLADWRAKAEVDTRFGGTPEKLGEALATAKTALDRFATPEFKSLVLEEMGLGDNPEFIHFVHQIGKAMSEDGMVSANAQAGGERVLGEGFYKNSTMNRT